MLHAGREAGGGVAEHEAGLILETPLICMIDISKEGIEKNSVMSFRLVGATSSEWN